MTILLSSFDLNRTLIKSEISTSRNSRLTGVKQLAMLCQNFLLPVCKEFTKNVLNKEIKLPICLHCKVRVNIKWRCKNGQEK